MIPESWLKGPLMWVALLVSLLLIFCWIMWDLASDQAEQRVKAEQSAQSHVEYAEDRIDRECLSLHGKALRDCIHQEIEAASDHDRANKDLDAQQQMAFFTKIMAWTAGGGLVLGAVSIIVIYATLREMGRTNQIMREESRPWIKFEFSAAFDTDNPQEVKIHAFPKNIGAKPAFDLTLGEDVFDFDVYGRMSIDEKKRIVTDVTAQAGRMSSLSPVVFPNEPGQGYVRSVAIDDANKRNWFLVICAAQYRDRHGGEIKTTVQSARVVIEPIKTGLGVGDSRSKDVSVTPWFITGAS